MPDLIQNALVARLHSVDWYYDHSDDYSVWKKEQFKVASLKLDFASMPIDKNQEILGDLYKPNEVDRNQNAISFLEMIIANQLLKKVLNKKT